MDSRCGSVETCRNTPAVLPGRGENMREESAYLESESMATVSLKNVKKIYPFSGDDIKRNKKKEKKRKQLEKKNPQALQAWV